MLLRLPPWKPAASSASLRPGTPPSLRWQFSQLALAAMSRVRSVAPTGLPVAGMKSKMALAGCFIGTDATAEVAPVGVFDPVAGALPETAIVSRWVSDALYETSPRSAMLFGGLTVIPASC